MAIISQFCPTTFKNTYIQSGFYNTQNATAQKETSNGPAAHFKIQLTRVNFLSFLYFLWFIRVQQNSRLRYTGE